MSSERGNTSRSRPQKYQNLKAFKNDLHDKSPQIKRINNLNHEGLCQRCKEKIEWKIKYKKYKPLTQPSTCVRCRQKMVKRAYYTVCKPCATQAEVCAKCNTKQEIVIEPSPCEKERMLQDAQVKFELQHLTERKRRALFRHVDKGKAMSEEAVIDTYDDNSDNEHDRHGIENDNYDEIMYASENQQDDSDVRSDGKCNAVDDLEPY